jgi:hypothetical protein
MEGRQAGVGTGSECVGSHRTACCVCGRGQHSNVSSVQQHLTCINSTKNMHAVGVPIPIPLVLPPSSDSIGIISIRGLQHFLNFQLV